MTEQRSDEAIRADLVKRGERSGPFPADGVQAALRRLANDVEPLLAERDSLRGVVQAVEADLADVEARFDVRKPDELSDWRNGVAWMIDRTRNVIADERARLARLRPTAQRSSDGGCAR